MKPPNRITTATTTCSNHHTPPNKNATTTTSDAFSIPANIQSIESLYWHKRQMALGQPAQIFPCYIVSPTRRNRIQPLLDSSDESDDGDDEDEVTVEYLSAHEKIVKRQTVMPKRLVPFHGGGGGGGNLVQDYDYEELGQLKWCEFLMEEYLKQRRRQWRSPPIMRGEGWPLAASLGDDFDEGLERRYLQQVLSVVKRRQGYPVCFVVGNKNDGKENCVMDNFGHGEENDPEDQEEEEKEEDNGLEEPYTQAVWSNHPSDDDDDNDGSSSSCSSTNSFDFGKRLKFRSNMETEQSNEPIRPGDVIEYYSPMFVFGSKQGRRIATVMSVNPNRNMILKLSNNEYLPNDTKVKRIKILVTVDDDDGTTNTSSTKQKMLLDHPGVFRRIRQFQLRRLKWPADYKIETETDRLKSIMGKNMTRLKENAKKLGFAPMDFMHRYGKRGSSSLQQDCMVDGKRNGNVLAVESDSDESDHDMGERNETHPRQRQDKSCSQNDAVTTESIAKRSMENNNGHNDEDSDDDSDCILKKLLYKSPKKQRKTNPTASLGRINTMNSKTLKHPPTTTSGYLSESDDSMMDYGIMPDALEKENQLKLLGLSDDELPQSVFDVCKTKHYKGTKTKKEVTPKLATSQQIHDLVDNSDSDSTSDSMNFHSSLSPTKYKDEAPEEKLAKNDKKDTKSVSLDDEVSSSTFSNSSDDDDSSVQVVVKKKNPDFKVVSNTIRINPHIGRNNMNDKKVNGCEKKACTKKFSNSVIPKSSLAISFRKYN